MKILLLGPQGSGKGTVGKLLSEELDLPLIGSGKMLRDLPPTHPRYEELNKLMDAGELVPQDFVGELLKDTTANLDKGYILDGWGRKMIDLDYFDPGFDYVIYIKLSRESSVKRISGRRVCEEDGTTCNIYTLPPENPGHCDSCGGKLIQRDDDTEEAVNKRLDIFYSDTAKVIEKFREEQKLIEVDGEPMPQEVLAQILTKLNVQNDSNKK